MAVIVTGVMAHENAGIDFSGTDWSWLESPVFLAILAAVYVVFWLLDRGGGSNAIRPGGRAMEASPGYLISCAAAGALLFAGSLADGGHAAWPGLIAGALLGLLGCFSFGRLFARANARLFAAGDPGIVLGLARDVATIAVTVLVVLVGVLGYLVVLAAIVIALAARRREGEKYEGLRILR